MCTDATSVQLRPDWAHLYLGEKLTAQVSHSVLDFQDQNLLGAHNTPDAEGAFAGYSLAWRLKCMVWSGLSAAEKCPGGSAYLCKPRRPFPGRRSMTFSRGHWIPSKSKEADATKPLGWGSPAQWDPQPPFKISLHQDIENFSEHHKVCTKRRHCPTQNLSSNLYV